jgi:hypothetical protein
MVIIIILEISNINQLVFWWWLGVIRIATHVRVLEKKNQDPDLCIDEFSTN